MAPGVAALAGSRVGGASDEALISATRAGSDEAFLALYDRYRDLAWRVARSVAANDLDAEDAVAEGFARIYAALPNRSIDSFRSYLAATVRNVATDAYRRRDQVREEGALEEPPPTEPGVEEQVETLDDHARVALAFAVLPERYRSALWLSEVERFTTSEIGHVVGTSANGAAALAMRARERLREAYLGLHLSQPLEPACADVTSKLASHVRGSAPRRVTTRVEQHVGSCSGCAGRLGELRTLNQSLAGVIPAAPAGLLAGDRILERATAGGRGPIQHPSMGDGGIREVGSRVADHAQSLAEIGMRAGAYSPGASSFADRILQPAAAAVAGLLVAGAASIGAPGLGAGADHPVTSDRGEMPAAGHMQFEGRGEAPFSLARHTGPTTQSSDADDPDGPATSAPEPGNGSGSAAPGVVADRDATEVDPESALPGEVGGILPENPVPGGGGGNGTPGVPEPVPPPDPCAPDGCPGGASIIPKIVDDVNDVTGQIQNEADQDVGDTVEEIESVVAPVPEPVEPAAMVAA